MKFLFVCGGTAGHINPALAIAAELRRSAPEADFLFVGADREMENRLIPRAGHKLVNIQMSGLKRGLSPAKTLANIKTAKNVMAASTQAKKIIREYEPDAVIGTGGYICYPVVKTASKMGVPTFLHESNAIAGLTTKMLSSCADRVFVAFPGLEKQYRRPARVIVTGTPVRDGFETQALETGTDRFPVKSKPLVVSFWGSLGAQHMNEIMAEFISLNIKKARFDHIHSTGKSGGLELLNKELLLDGLPEDLPSGIDIREYIDDMPKVMSEADVILCRAGGSTIAELTAIGKPAVLIPSPYVTNDQQVRNAEQVQKHGGAVMLLEKDCTGRILFDAVSSIIDDENTMKSMSEAQKALGFPDAAKRIAAIIIGFCKASA